MVGVAEALRDLGRGATGALLLGTPLIYTMESWWLGWTLPAEALAAYAFGGLLLALGLVDFVGFREEEVGPKRPHLRRLAADYAELVLQSALAAAVVLFGLGILDPGTTLVGALRLILMLMVPLGLGAAIANRALAAGGDDPGEAPFPKDLALFAVGAVLFTLPIVPTEEMPLMASHMGWARAPIVMGLSLLVTYLTLYELGFRGQAGRRIGNQVTLIQVGDTALVYCTALAVSLLLLAGFGHLTGQPAGVWIQEAVILAFPAALGGSAARVIL